MDKPASAGFFYADDQAIRAVAVSMLRLDRMAQRHQPLSGHRADLTGTGAGLQPDDGRYPVGAGNAHKHV